MAVSLPLPYRGDGADRPAELVLPPRRMPLARDGRPLKRWRYVGAFGERLMLCAAEVRIGPARQWFWAVWDRERGALRERTLLWRGAAHVAVPPGRVWVDDGSVRMDLLVEPGPEAVETASMHGRGWIWTRKQCGVRVHGTVVLAGETIALEARGCVDESAGYHARHTAWEWTTGVGRSADGRDVAWNLVAGVHDDARASERSVWVDGVASHVAPARFAPDGVATADGTALAFTSEAARRRRDELLVFASDYTAPFGTFTGTLPGGLELAEGFGVMERHTARW